MSPGAIKTVGHNGEEVAPICNLLYSRIAFCGPLGRRTALGAPEACRLQIGDTADCKSALQLQALSDTLIAGVSGFRATPGRAAVC